MAGREILIKNERITPANPAPKYNNIIRKGINMIKNISIADANIDFGAISL